MGKRVVYIFCVAVILDNASAQFSGLFGPVTGNNNNNKKTPLFGDEFGKHVGIPGVVEGDVDAFVAVGGDREKKAPESEKNKILAIDKNLKLPFDSSAGASGSVSLFGQKTPSINQVADPNLVLGKMPSITNRGGCETSITEATVSGPICKGQLLFEDNFDKDVTDSPYWLPEIKFPNGPDYPFNFYHVLNDNLKVVGNKLFIKPILLDSVYGPDVSEINLKEKCTGLDPNTECVKRALGPSILPPVITAKITTKEKFSFKYGRVEVRARMPQGDWLVPEIQLEPRNNKYGALDYASGLLRIASVKGNALFSKTLFGGPIVSAKERNILLKQKDGNENWNKDFHNYSLEWRPDGISLYVDGEEYGEYKPKSDLLSNALKTVQAVQRWATGTSLAPFDDLFYLSIALNVGGVVEFPDDANKPWKNGESKAMVKFANARGSWASTWRGDSAALQVDSVKVYAL